MTPPPNLETLRAAIVWQLQAVPAETVEKAAQAVFNLVHMGQGVEPPENAMAVILKSLGVIHGGRVASVFRALVATGALEENSWHTFYPAAYAVFEAHRQAQRAAGRVRGDALDDLLREMLEEVPDFTPINLWAEVSRLASNRTHPALDDYDPGLDVVSFEPHPGAELRDIGFQAFRRRVQRLRNRTPATVKGGNGRGTFVVKETLTRCGSALPQNQPAHQEIGNNWPKRFGDNG